jgi:hypothetical protein
MRTLPSGCALLVIVEDEGHRGAAMTQALVSATRRFPGPAAR